MPTDQPTDQPSDLPTEAGPGDEPRIDDLPTGVEATPGGVRRIRRGDAVGAAAILVAFLWYLSVRILALDAGGAGAVVAVATAATAACAWWCTAVVRAEEADESGRRLTAEACRRLVGRGLWLGWALVVVAAATMVSAWWRGVFVGFQGAVVLAAALVILAEVTRLSEAARALAGRRGRSRRPGWSGGFLVLDGRLRLPTAVPAALATFCGGAAWLAVLVTQYLDHWSDSEDGAVVVAIQLCVLWVPFAGGLLWLAGSAPLWRDGMRPRTLRAVGVATIGIGCVEGVLLVVALVRFGDEWGNVVPFMLVSIAAGLGAAAVGRLAVRAAAVGAVAAAAH